MKVEALDLNFQGVEHTIASYLVEGPAGYVLVETGPMSTLEKLKERLQQRGLAPADIGHVLVTHIHLDHAGAAGWWAQQGAQIYVHHVGAPHLTDPSKLWSSARRIYGATMESLWGEIWPAPAERITALYDGDTVDVAGLTFTALDTPGHAWHHHVFRLGDVAFTGDAAGVRVFGSQWISLPAPPPEFQRDKWLDTLQRLAAERFSALYLTHFGRVDAVDDHLQQFRDMLQAATTHVRQQMEAGVARDELIKRYVEWNRERASASGMSADTFAKYEVANPFFMSVDGIMRYMRKQAAEEQ